MGPVVGASLGGHRSTGEGLSTEYGATTGHQSISVEAHGGYSLVAWSFSEWSASLSDHLYWRVIKQNEVKNVLAFLTEISSSLPNKPFSRTIEGLQKVLRKRLEKPKQNEKDILKISYGNDWRWLPRPERIVPTLISMDFFCLLIPHRHHRIYEGQT